MNKYSFNEAVNISGLSDQTKFRLHEIIKIEDYFNSEIQKRKIMSKKLSKYIAAFGYFDKALVILSATSGGVSIISIASVIGAPAGIASASFTQVFSLATGIIKKLLQITRNKKKKHNKIVVLAKSKLNSIETLMSQALIDLEYKTVVDEKEKYEKMNENIRIIKSSDELGERNSVLSYQIDLHFPKHKLAMEVDEKRPTDRDKKKNRKTMVIQKELGCKFIRINPDAENYIFVEIVKIQNHIFKLTKKLTKKSTKTSLIDKISKRLLELEFRSMCLKLSSKKYCHQYKICKLIV